METKLEFTKEIKAKWLAALKSGEYIQGAHELENKSMFCCLGVLCDIHDRLGIDSSVDDDAVLLDGKYPTKEAYQPLYDMLGQTNCIDIAAENDQNCDGKYTAVIPLIEKLPTID